MVQTLLGHCWRETLGLLAQRIVVAFPNLNVVGFEAPPFRPITPEEDAESVERINTSGAGLVFVGLGWGAADAADLVIAVCRLAAMRFRNVP